MEEIISKINTLKEDKPWIVLTDDIIKEYILEDINLLISEIKEEL